ncbi:MFS transporter [Clostridium beijerinckii]|uniref:MFS family permease n=1 Tax=Clostridium beijerinckii TaxID=1520 RepID=A0A0B5QUE3_CLOBE|nr:MFS transporter [Clostridium beijerinckii]AJH01623.1 MFS transporter [Clostridium beijerinckii]AQS07429.1 inner membrane transport protein YdiM [Clostridium beijerinckii]MBA2884509.1 MFS family permease [Clostridium beijerinckii]MBA2898121.1 MFS family permease [Clostridium beijerinckii]MBA2909972.1 MFS family permease [Clostridium beijerinckii]
MNNKKYYPTALALYFTYFIHGIGVSILGQYKQNFAGAWGADKLSNGTFDVSMVLAVIAALGLGRLITLPFSGPISDRFGRKISGLIGVVLYVAYFIGIAISPNMYVAYAFALLGGAANSFLDTCVTPSCLEIFVNSGDVANMFTKFSISIGQFLLPFIIGFIAASNMSYTTIFFVTGIALAIDGILIAIAQFPPKNGNVNTTKDTPIESEKMKFTATSIAVICIGFTCTSTFQLWLNCNQELGKLYGLANPSQIQTYYALGSMAAVLVTAALVKSFLKPVRILVIYPAISAIMLLIIYFVQTPEICLIGGFIIGYSAAGGVLQLAVSTANSMFPTNKGKITSIVMIASSVANYVILNAASYISKSGGLEGPKYVLIFNVVITAVGILLALFVNKQYAKAEIK